MDNDEKKHIEDNFGHYSHKNNLHGSTFRSSGIVVQVGEISILDWLINLSHRKGVRMQWLFSDCFAADN